MIVKLTYFKDTGKYYTEGEYDSEAKELFQIWDEVRALRIEGKLPGLVEGSREWTILVDVPEHPNAHPRLLPYFFVEKLDDRFPPAISSHLITSSIHAQR